MTIGPILLAPPWVKDPLYKAAKAVPSLDLNFARDKALGGLVTFTRAYSGTFVGSDGVLRTAANDVPRFDHNPTTGESLGLLVEEQRTNVVLQSQDLATTWASTATSASVSTNTTTAPDGTLTADTITALGSTIGRVQQTITFTGDGDKAISVWLKAGTAPTSVLKIDDSTAGFVLRLSINVTWTNGVASAVAGNGILQGIDAFPNGWYRIRGLAVGVVAANTNRYRIEADTTNGTGTVIAWGAQAENGAFSTSYIPTTGTTATRSADVASITGTNFSSWYRQDEGTVFASVRLASLVNTYEASFTDNSNNNHHFLRYLSGQHQVATKVGGVDGTSIFSDGGGGIAATRNAYGYRANSFAISTNGLAGNSSTTTANSVPAVDRLNIGMSQLAGATGNLHVTRLTYWPQRLSNTTLQQVTQ